MLVLPAWRDRGELMRHAPWLNQQVALHGRMRAAFEGATRVRIAAAYAKSSGTSKLLQLDPPRGSRAVAGHAS